MVSARLIAHRREGGRGFTLIELLVVVVIIGLLIAIILPSLLRAKEQAVRASCAARLRMWAQAEHLYGAENNTALIPGTRDMGDGPGTRSEHVIFLEISSVNQFLDYGKNKKMLGCPRAEKTLPTLFTAQPSKPNADYLLGYSYLAGHGYKYSWGDQGYSPINWPTTNGWFSPLSTNDPPGSVVASDMNDWEKSGWTLAPHAFYKYLTFASTGGQTPKQVGSAGGNVAYLDGSVQWVPIDKMKAYATTSNGGTDYQTNW